MLGRQIRAGVSGLYLALVLSFSAHGQEEKSYSETLAAMEKTAGMITFFRDRKNGTLHMELGEDQLAEGSGFIYHAQMVNSVSGVPLPQLGDYGQAAFMTFRRHYDRIEFRKENTAYYFDPDNPLARASDANIQPSIVGLGRIVKISDDGKRFLVNVDGLFRNEMLEQIVSVNSSLSANPFVSKVTRIDGYARNVRVIVAHAYDSDGSEGHVDLPDARTFTATIQHSFIALPAPGFKPRRDDYRVGYFTRRITDLTSPSVTPWADVIRRWRLEKKDPQAELSEPVKPITFWIQNTTPLEYRQTIIDAGLGWNAAFEKAGFKNAIEIKVQPDDATWDAGDVDYNVLRWVSTPQTRYYGFGPSLVDPRTGEILAADIMLEQAAVHGMNRSMQSLAGPSGPDDPGDIAAMLKAFASDQGLEESLDRCAIDTAIGAMALLPQSAAEFDDNEGYDRATEVTEFKRQILHFLITHEIGHTLGLAHNFIASTWVDYDASHSDTYKDAGMLSASVMDYPDLNVASTGKPQGLYFPTKPGPYDQWAIEFGYTPDLEGDARDALLDRSTEPGLAYSISFDDPRVAIWDMSDDPLSFAIDRIALIEGRLKVIRSEMIADEDNRDRLWSTTGSLLNQKNRQGALLGRYIGGVYEEHANVGQPGATTPYQAVSLVDQKRAMAALSRHFLAPDAWSLPDELIADLQRRRRGFEKPGLALTATNNARQSAVLVNLMNPATMARLSEARNHGNSYTAGELLSDLTKAVFDEDLKGTVNVNRQNLQNTYVNALMFVSFAGFYDAETVAAALQELRGIEARLKRPKGADEVTRAHQSHLHYYIRASAWGEAVKPRDTRRGWQWFSVIAGSADKGADRMSHWFAMALMSLLAER